MKILCLSALGKRHPQPAKVEKNDLTIVATAPGGRAEPRPRGSVRLSDSGGRAEPKPKPKPKLG